MKKKLNELFSSVFQFGNFRDKSKSDLKEFFPLVGFLLENDIKELEKLFGLKINNPAIFEQAFTHRSYIPIASEKIGKKVSSNERLEYLGDAIVDMIIAEYLFFENESVSEGSLTKMRAWFVNKNALAMCARQLGIKKYVQLSFSASKSLENGSDSLLADAVEAIIAAIYIDSGMDKARIFVESKILNTIKNIHEYKDLNYKSLLLEKVQADGKEAPTYKVIDEVGPDHKKEFRIAVFVAENQLGIGQGTSKKSAEQSAAKNALDSLENVEIL